MKFRQKLISATLIKRYKRFLADVRLENGEEITVHCPNSGSMKSCATPGWKVLLSKSANPKRKYPYTWEMVHNSRCWIGVNTGIPNQIVTEALQDGRIQQLADYNNLRREVRYGENSRIDILLESVNQKCYVEVKNVSLVEDDGDYYFPDAVTERGRKHLHELQNMVKEGNRAAMFFVIQRSDGKVFHPAQHIDPAYSNTLREASLNGVELLAYRAEVTPEFIDIAEAIPIEL